MRWLFLVICCLMLNVSHAQSTTSDDLGAWYMYFFNAPIQESKWGFQGDVQYRNWNLIGDLEQLLLRGGLTYKPNEKVMITLGYGHITTGEIGESNAVKYESRIYQEFLLPHKVSDRIRLKHRFRYEQRFVDNQDFRTRYRYNLFLTVPLNKSEMEKGTVYASLYNELFINGQKEIGNNNQVEYFDRNRFYVALGYQVSKSQKIQVGYMNQTLNSIDKNQVQLSWHSSW